MRHLLVWLKRLILLPFLLLLAYQLWLLAWVIYWKYENPAMTRFMEIRLSELRDKNPDIVLKKQWVPYANISGHLKHALIASEDSKFVAHNGFDWDGIKAAMEKNRSRGHVVAGGSTISQQLAKNLFLSPAKTPWRKAEEAVVTVMIETLWSKRRIFEVYLNVIEWGNGVFGAEAAAKYYFATRAANLSVQQAAYLAAMVPKPRFYDTHRATSGLASRASTIAARMPTVMAPR